MVAKILGNTHPVVFNDGPHIVDTLTDTDTNPPAVLRTLISHGLDCVLNRFTKTW